MEEKAKQYEMLAMLQSPYPLFFGKVGRWYYIFDNESSLKYISHFFRQQNNESTVDFTRIARNEFKYHGVGRGKTELKAWRNACQNLLNPKKED